MNNNPLSDHPDSQQSLLDEHTLLRLITQYEEVYMFTTKNVERILIEKVLPMSLEAFGILRILFLKGPLQPKDIAEYCCIHKSTVTIKSNQLFELGLIERRYSEQDRRNIHLYLTPKGIEVSKQAEKEIAHIVASHLSELSAEELTTFIKIYDKLSSLIKQEKKKGNIL
jgi:DNA-binding MarR family transcriptional regulator